MLTGGGLSLLISHNTGWHATDALYQMCQWSPPWVGLPYEWYCDWICGGVIILGMIGLGLAIKKALDDDPRQLYSLLMVWATQVRWPPLNPERSRWWGRPRCTRCHPTGRRPAADCVRLRNRPRRGRSSSGCSWRLGSPTPSTSHTNGSARKSSGCWPRWARSSETSGHARPTRHEPRGGGIIFFGWRGCCVEGVPVIHLPILMWMVP